MDNRFALTNEPMAYIISVHISNILQTKDLDEDIKMRHIQNLIYTYGVIEVEFTIKDLFPSVYNNLFQEVA